MAMPVIYKSKQQLSAILIVLFFVALSLLFCLPLLKDIYVSCRGDWDYFFSLYEIPLISLFEYHQLPLWNPYSGGGLPYMGNPQQGFPSPIFVVTALFGVIAGLKISVWLHTFAGLYGTWLLSEEMGVKGVARLAPPIIFMFSGAWVFHLTEGHIVWLPAAFLPFVLLAFLKGHESRRWLVAAAVFESIIIYEGGTYVFAYAVLFLAVFTVCLSLQTASPKPVAIFVAINLLAAALAAPKLLPMLDLLVSHPRIVAVGRPLSWDDLLAAFIERDSILGAMVENNAYIGVPALLLYAFGIATVRKQTMLVVSSLFMMLLALGNFASFAPWTLLHALPFFRNFQFPTRSLVIFFFTVALMIGLYLTRLTKKSNIWLTILAGAIVLFIGADLFLFGRQVFRQATVPVQASIFSLSGTLKLDKPSELYHLPPQLSPGIGRSVASVHQPFVQVSIPGMERFRHGAWSDQHLPLLQNRGVIDAYETIPFERHALAASHKDYKGEYHLVNNGEVNLVKWSPNRLDFHVRMNRADRLVINQNYWNGWHSSIGNITNQKGLLSVDLPPGEYEVAVTYRPKSFLLGISLFCLTVGGVVALLLRDARMRGQESRCLSQE